MAYTNVSIYNMERYKERQYLKAIEAERDWWKGEFQELHRRLSNILEAVEQFGYVDIYSEETKKVTTLIKQEQKA